MKERLSYVLGQRMELVKLKVRIVSFLFFFTALYQIRIFIHKYWDKKNLHTTDKTNNTLSGGQIS